MNKCLNCIILREKLTNLQNKIIELEGWKGKDEIKIFRCNDFWEIIEHRKNKTDLSISTNKLKIPHKNVVFMWSLIKKYAEINKKTKKGYFFEKIIIHKNLNIDINSFNGGKYRKKYYFPLYYYPLKILEHIKYIKYWGGGCITRLK